jgi:hypothetical protein
VTGFTRADLLADIQRTLWRRDPCLGAGYGFSSFIAWVSIWTSGDEDQRRPAAELLLSNGKIAAAFHRGRRLFDLTARLIPG